MPNDRYIWAQKMVKIIDKKVDKLCPICTKKEDRDDYFNKSSNPEKIYKQFNIKRGNKTGFIKNVTTLINKVIQLKYFIEYEIYNSNDDDEISRYQILNNRINKINELLELYLKNEKAQLHYEQTTNLDLLTRINTIFLPLGFIVNFFGMNFAVKHNPILGWKYGFIFVIILLILVVIFSDLFLNYYYNSKEVLSKKIDDLKNLQFKGGE